jgi:transposase
MFTIQTRRSFGKDLLIAHQALQFIKNLYKVEKLAEENFSTADEVNQWRNSHAPPILNSFRKWLIEQQKRVLPRTTLGGAIGYILSLLTSFFPPF